jgi:hypothetical protein
MLGKAVLVATTCFEQAPNATRSGADLFSIKVETGRLELRRNLYNVIVINNWNRIPVDIKSRQGTPRFKAEYRKFREMHPA